MVRHRQSNPIEKIRVTLTEIAGFYDNPLAALELLLRYDWSHKGSLTIFYQRAVAARQRRELHHQTHPVSLLEIDIESHFDMYRINDEGVMAVPTSKRRTYDHYTNIDIAMP